MAIWKCQECGNVVEARCKPGKCKSCGAVKDRLLKEEVAGGKTAKDQKVFDNRISKIHKDTKAVPYNGNGPLKTKGWKRG